MGESAASLVGLPPVTGLIGGCDILHDEVVSYFNALDAAGVDIDWRQWDQATHGFCITCPGSLMSAYGRCIGLFMNQRQSPGVEPTEYVANRLSKYFTDVDMEPQVENTIDTV